MNYKIINGSISYGAETILEEINFEIKEKDKIAIVGRNGCGKSTFLNAIVDNSMLEEGIGEEKFNVYRQGNPIIGFLKQMNFEDEITSLKREMEKEEYSTDYLKLKDLQENIDNINALIEEKMIEWDSLNEKIYKW